MTTPETNTKIPPSSPSLLTEAEKQELEDVISKEGKTGEMMALVNKILILAVSHRASDIHVEPMKKMSLIRFRVDGVLYDVIQLPSNLHEPFVARIKILSELKIDEHRIPQDGRFTGTIESRTASFRVSLVPLIFGEKVAIRILSQEIQQETLEELGFNTTAKSILEANLRRPYGMILICGPTGSGKTTTLYTLLQNLFQERGISTNINTIEDPVEYTIPRVNQIQIVPEVGLTFSAGLRGLLRQDTDIVMVGEIRDRETAEAATQASLTGRLLLSSLHTRNAVGAVIRLLDIGIEPYLIASAITVAVAQRLVRVICPSCVEPYTIDQQTFNDLDKRFKLSSVLDRLEKTPDFTGKITRPPQLYRSKGCNECHHTGFQGRIGIFEVLEITEPMRELIQRRTPSSELRAQAAEEGMITMLQDGFEKALSGKTTLEEVLRVSLD